MKHVRNIKFVASTETNDPTVSKQMLQHSEEQQSSKVEKASHSRMCHYYKKKGHIRPFYYELYGFPQQHHQRTQEPEVINIKKECRPKCDDIGLIAHTSLRASSSEDWYFDSGCYRHMTRMHKFLVEVRPYASSYVTFGDRAKRKIVGIGKLVSDGLPRLNNVLLVKGLTANLISISQLCDQGMVVNFSKSECQVTDEKAKVNMRGTRSKDNCYLRVSQEKA